MVLLIKLGYDGPMNSRAYLILAIFIILILSIALGVATFWINFWPTDSYFFYLPTARELFKVEYLSQMHDVLPGTIVMHGKETLVLGIAIMQKMLNDTQSLYPNVLLLIIATAISSLSIYSIGLRIFAPRIAFLCFILFITSFWSWMYALQGAHQPLALMFFLLTVVCLQNTSRHGIFALLAGLCLGFMSFSSPTALLYLPYFFLFFVFYKNSFQLKKIKHLALATGLFLSGMLAVILLFTFPNPIQSLKEFSIFLSRSQGFNHFYLYRSQLSLLDPLHFGTTHSDFFRGAGLIWIIKYFFLIMPFLFSAYLVSLGYLFQQGFKKKKILLVIFISLATPWAVEAMQAAQFGRNYFSWLMGMLFVIGYTAHLRSQKGSFSFQLKLITGIWIAGHLILNIFVFFTDIFPTRMATASLDRYLRKNHIEQLWTYPQNPYKNVTTDVLNNPKLKEKIQFTPMQTIHDPTEGYVLIPPTSSYVLHNNCIGEDWITDPGLKKLLDQGGLESYTVTIFPTIGSSRIWTQEEEVCSYRDLILGDMAKSRKKSKIYILDVKKLQSAWEDSLPDTKLRKNPL
ncbi:MAG: hypothetical protein NUV91_01435 [Candidatus Omnitrophica bacterium]|nr:hypothetical protein [Candidatus Omnitrophota bacterium]